MDKTYSIMVTGRVQGVGFRPFVCRLGKASHLTGRVKNLGGIVAIRATGAEEDLVSFLEGLRRASEPARVETVSFREEALQPFEDFRSVPSDGAAKEPVFPADLGICPDCLRELHDPQNRHYGYPYISCTACGPRYTIIRKLPYDRINTTMAEVAFCPDCRREYREEADRRCHGETISCPHCGPQLYGLAGGQHLEKDKAMEEAVRLVKEGAIVIIKSIGGYNLVCRGDRAETVHRLRILKERDRKPFALMVTGLEQAERLCVLSEEERKLLTSAVRPIVLLPKQNTLHLPKETCDKVPLLGLFLPPSGFYALLTEQVGVPLIVTSCNRSGEPILFRDDEARAWFEDHPDVAGFFSYDREILRSADDSVVKADAGVVQVLRRTRGFLPEPALRHLPEGRVLACGADMEPSFCLTGGGRLYPAQIPCELDSEVSECFLKESEADWEAMLGIAPDRVVTDLHSGYVSTRWGREAAAARHLPLLTVQHHHAHALSVMAEHRLDGPCLAFVFDGTGAGTDGTVWGGEILLCKGTAMKRVGHLKTIPMLGGDESMKQAWKSAMCHLAAAGLGAAAAWDKRFAVVKAALDAGVNTIGNSSIGRLFDGVAAFLGLASENTFKGECPMALEEAAHCAAAAGREPLPLSLRAQEEDGILVWDAAPLWRGLLDFCGTPFAALPEEQRAALRGKAEVAALGFHEALAAMIADSAGRFGIRDVVLTGGCFANGTLLARAAEKLRRQHFRVFVNEAVPCGDGGISLGQAFYGLLCGLDGKDR